MKQCLDIFCSTKTLRAKIFRIGIFIYFAKKLISLTLEGAFSIGNIISYKKHHGKCITKKV